MRIGLVMAFLIGTSLTALADNGPVFVPGRLGVPIIINGVDVSYAVVEGDWGFLGGYNRSLRCTADATSLRTACRSLLSESRSRAWLRPPRNRAAAQSQATTASRKFPSVVVGPFKPDSRAIRHPADATCGDPRAHDRTLGFASKLSLIRK